MDSYKQWLFTRSHSILPTTFNSNSNSSFSECLLDGVSNLWKALTSKEKHAQASVTPFHFTPNQDRKFTKSASASSLVHAAFPSYLNTGSSFWKPDPQCHRRSSLLVGCEQTMHLMATSKKQTRLVLPKNNERGYKSKRELIEHAHLPVPVVQPPRFNVPNTLYGYLDESTLKKGVKQYSTKSSITTIFLLFLLSLSCIALIYRHFPEMREEEYEKMKLPKNIEEAKELGRILSKYKNTNYYEVTLGFFITYIFLQTFAIPGSVFLSILSGFLYPFYLALFLVCLCSGIGATGCYMISYFVGKPLITKYLWQRVQRWNAVVDGHREYLLNYLLFLRITPFLPNWFINVVSPVIHIPVRLFFIATFIGVAPLSFIAIQGGTTLYQLTTAGDAFSWTGVIVMAVLALGSMLPVIFQHALKKKFE